MQTFYEFITSFSENMTRRGQLARDLLWLSERFPVVKEINSFYDLVSLASNSLIHRQRMLGGDLSPDGFYAVDDGLWVEYCGYEGRSPSEEGPHRIPEYPSTDWMSEIPAWMMSRMLMEEKKEKNSSHPGEGMASREI